MTTTAPSKLDTTRRISLRSSPQRWYLILSSRASGKGAMSGTFSCVRAKLVVVAKNPDHNHKKLRKVLIGSSGISEEGGDCPEGRGKLTESAGLGIFLVGGGFSSSSDSSRSGVEGSWN